jgi:hypothetical protein
MHSHALAVCALRTLLSCHPMLTCLVERRLCPTALAPGSTTPRFLSRGHADRSK